MNFFYRVSKSKEKKIFFILWRGAWGAARVSDFFFFTKDPNRKFVLP